MKRAILLLALALAGLPFAAASAQTATPAASQKAEAPWVDAEVRRVDRDTGKVTLRHADIPNLGMPGMTMVFQATQPAQLESLQVGDKVRFRAAERDGTYLATDLERAR